MFSSSFIIFSATSRHFSNLNWQFFIFFFTVVDYRIKKQIFLQKFLFYLSFINVITIKMYEGNTIQEIIFKLISNNKFCNDARNSSIEVVCQFIVIWGKTLNYDKWSYKHSIDCSIVCRIIQLYPNSCKHLTSQLGPNLIEGHCLMKFTKTQN